MKKWLLAAAVWLADAAPAAQNVLPVTCGAGRYTEPPAKGARLLWVEQVTVPDYLAGMGWFIKPVMCSM